MNNSTEQIKQKILRDLCYELITESEVYECYGEPSEINWETLENYSGITDYINSPEIEEKSAQFFNRLHQLYPTEKFSRIYNLLLEQFGSLAPQNWLEAIAQRAEITSKTTSSQLNQLIDCVKPLLSNWLTEDLEVFARPVISSLRGSPTGNNKNWTDLSELEKARLTIAIAKVALEHCQNQDSSI